MDLSHKNPPSYVYLTLGKSAPVTKGYSVNAEAVTAKNLEIKRILEPLNCELINDGLICRPNGWFLNVKLPGTPAAAAIYGKKVLNALGDIGFAVEMFNPYPTVKDSEVYGGPVLYCQFNREKLDQLLRGTN